MTSLANQTVLVTEPTVAWAANTSRSFSTAE